MADLRLGSARETDVVLWDGAAREASETVQLRNNWTLSCAKDDRRRLVHTSSAMRSLLFSEWPILTQAAGSRSRVSLRELGGRI